LAALPIAEFSRLAVMMPRSPNGKQVVDVVSPSNPSVYAVAVNRWCRLGVAVQVGGGWLGEGNEPSRVAILVRTARRTTSVLSCLRWRATARRGARSLSPFPLASR
jgi:hypothetical protein